MHRSKEFDSIIGSQNPSAAVIASLETPGGMEVFREGLQQIAFTYGILSPGDIPVSGGQWEEDARERLDILTDPRHPDRLKDYGSMILGIACEYNDLWNTAHTDKLTGLPNLRWWLKDLEYGHRWVNEHYRKYAGRLHEAPDERALMLAYVDVDCFKPINDSLGHLMGNEVLVRIAKLLRSQVRKADHNSALADFVARLGGDEFGVLMRLHLPHSDRVGGDRRGQNSIHMHKAANGIAERLTEAIEAKVELFKQELAKGRVEKEKRVIESLGVSMGFVLLELGETKDEFTGRADKAMYEIKAIRKARQAQQDRRQFTMRHLEVLSTAAKILEGNPRHSRLSEDLRVLTGDKAGEWFGD